MPVPKVRLNCDPQWRYMTQDGSSMYFWSRTPRFGRIWDTLPSEGTLLSIHGKPFPIITEKDCLKIVEVEHADTIG